MNESIVRNLLNDFFDGKSTSIQRKMIEDWLAEADNCELFYRYLDEWESAHPQFTPHAGQALSLFNAVLKKQEAAVRLSSGDARGGDRSWFSFRLRSKVAAVLIVLLAAGMLFQKQLLYKTLTSDTGETTLYMLQDGTQVLLNSNSTLTVPRFGFGKGNREVMLDGEAEFKVTHTASHDRFIVEMGSNYKVEVLGTEFVAFSRARGKRIFLKQGKVKVQLPKGRQLYMKTGSLFVSNERGDFKMTEQADPQPYTAWKRQSFYFDSTRMADVAVQAGEYFDVKIEVSDSTLANRRIAGIYKAEELDDFLQILSELMQIEIIQKDDHIELSTPRSQFHENKPNK
jgi:ferric-dicitrate binding protein FerR (iron transport regulator)